MHGVREYCVVVGVKNKAEVICRKLKHIFLPRSKLHSLPASEQASFTDISDVNLCE